MPSSAIASSSAGSPTLGSALDALSSFVILLTPDGLITQANQPLLSLTGVASKDVIGIPLWECVWWRHDPALQHRLRQAAALARQGEIQRFDVILRTHDERLLPLDFNLASLRDDTGQTTHLVASATDISGQRAGEAALDRSEARFRHVFEGAPDGIAMVDNQGRMALVNGAMERLFGYDRTEMVGQPIEMLIPQRYLPGHHQWRTAYMHAPTTRDMAGRKELYARRKDGSEFPAEIGLNPLRLPEGVFVLATVFDVTQRRADEQIIQRALQEKTALLNEVHHRVKNNLQVISSLLNLQARHAPAEARHFLDESQGRVKAMALIHQLLYERHDYARVSLALYLRRLGKLLHESLSIQRGAIRIVEDCQDDSAWIDLQRAIPCGLIVNELVTNAIKHAFPDGRNGSINIRLRRDDSGRCHILVEDDGIGLPEHVRLGEASSLGFQLVPLLVEQLGGELKIERGTGTRFILSFQPASGEDS